MSRRASSFREQYGPWAVVTGASDGIGREVARALAETGVHVVLVARRQPQLEALARELSHRCGVQTRVAAMDLAALPRDSSGRRMLLRMSWNPISVQTVSKAAAAMPICRKFRCSGPTTSSREDENIT